MENNEVIQSNELRAPADQDIYGYEKRSSLIFQGVFFCIVPPMAGVVVKVVVTIAANSPLPSLYPGVLRYKEPRSEELEAHFR